MKETANRYTIALLSVIMVCLLAVPAMAQEEIVWQHSAVMPWDAERLVSGNTLIAETGNNTVIEVNTTTSEIVWQYGTGIAGSDPLNSPVDAERLLSGNTLITDRNNHRVIEVNTTGAIIWQYGTTGTPGSGYDELNNPMDAERLSNGNTLIADRLNNRVIEVNESKEIVWEYGITNPFDADRLSNGNTLIAEYTNHRVIEINESDEIVWQYGTGTFGPGVNQLWYPMDADRLPDGSTLIADHTNDRVIEVRTSDYDPAKTDNGFTAASIVWVYWSNQPADADRLSSGSTLISEAGNHRVIEVGVASASTSWHDTFDDETKIAETQGVIVSGGDVEIDVVNISSLWHSDSSLVAGLEHVGYTKPSIAFNITGDGRWNLISGTSGGGFSGFYWNGTQWITDTSLVSGLGDIGSHSTPTIAFNITGDGRWNLIAGEYYGEYYGFYWNGTQWINDSSLVAGLGDVGYRSAPEIAFNSTGDGKWDMISGYSAGRGSGGGFYGYYWDGTQWISDSPLVAGLGYIGGWDVSPTPTLSFITGDERCNLIYGARHGGFYGYYWDGTQWISDSSLVSGLGDVGSYSAPEMAFNITGDGRWNLVAGIGGEGGFSGYCLVQGSVKSVLIQRSLPYFKSWTVFNANDTVPAGTNIAYKILDENDNTIMNVASGQDILGITETSIRLFAELVSSEPPYTPVLHDWSVCWETGEVDLLPTAIETPTVYPNLTFAIDVVIANNGEAHSGRFNVVLYANDTELGTAFSDDIPAGENTTVTFEWTPVHTGNYNLMVIADSDDAIVESDEANNKVVKEVTVLTTDLSRLTFDSGSSINPKVVSDSLGNIHVVWQDDRDGNREIYYKKFDANGNVLVNDMRATNTSRSSVAPVAAVDSTGNIYIAWQEESGSDYRVNDYHIYYTKLDSSGSVLVGATRIEATAYWDGYVRLHGITIDSSGNIRLLWEQYVTRYPSNWNKVWYGRFDDTGSPLEDILCVGEVGGLKCNELHSLYPSFALDSSDNVHIAYSVRYKGIDCRCGSGFGGGQYWSDHECPYPDCLREIYYRKIDIGGTLHDALRLTDDNRTFASFTPDVSVDADDNVHVVWVNNNVTYDPDYMWYYGEYPCVPEPGGYFDGHSYDLYYTKLDNNGNTLFDDTRMTFDCSPDHIPKPSIDTGFGVTYIAWSASREVYYMAIDTSGGTLMNMTLMSLDDEFDSWEPSLTACNDGARVVWTDNRDGNNEIYYSKTEAPPNGVFILAPPDQFTAQNIVATYTIGILSTMPNTETFTIERVNLDRADVAELSDTTITIDPDSIGEVTLNVTDRSVGDYRVTVTVASQTMQDSATITTSVIVPIADLLITAMDAYHNGTGYSPLFNLSNEVDVTMKNVGTADAGTFDVCLYADDMLVDTQSVSGLGYGSYTTMQFKWTPVGMDCEDGGSPQTYTLKAIADCGDVITESDETNNELTVAETAYWAGYSADEELVEASHGTVRGGLLYTTGDGGYVGLYNHGSYKDTHYEITLPESASVRHARLNVYYTWSRTGTYPMMEVSITNATGTYTVPLAASYNDRPCPSPAIGFEYPWGNYVYDLTPYIPGRGSYTVRVTNIGTADNPSSFCPSAPGLVIVYEESSMPEYEYWILEGADILEGGRRGGAGYLALEECINNATFNGSIDMSSMVSATLGMVSIWGGEAWGKWTSHYWFNDNYLGDGRIMDGYFELYDRTVDGMSMYVGASGGAQVGANVSDVTDCIKSGDNFVSFGDDGDSMMPSNAFLLVEHEYCREEKPDPAFLVPFMISGFVTNCSDGTPIDNPDVTIKNLNTGKPLIVETHNDSNYYQVLASLDNVSCGDVLQFTCDGTRLKHTVRQREVDVGCFVLDIAVGMMPEAIEAGVTFSPKKLDLNSSGVLKAYITLPEDHDVANISVSTIKCEGAPVFGFGKVMPGKQALEVKFKIHNLTTVSTGDAVLLTVTGELYDETPFEASNTLKVV